MHDPDAFRGMMREELQKPIAGILGNRNNEIGIHGSRKNTLKTYTSIFLSDPFGIFEEILIVERINEPGVVQTFRTGIIWCPSAKSKLCRLPDSFRILEPVINTLNLQLS